MVNVDVSPGIMGHWLRYRLVFYQLQRGLGIQYRESMDHLISFSVQVSTYQNSSFSVIPLSIQLTNLSSVKKERNKSINLFSKFLTTLRYHGGAAGEVVWDRIAYVFAIGLALNFEGQIFFSLFISCKCWKVKFTNSLVFVGQRIASQSVKGVLHTLVFTWVTMWGSESGEHFSVVEILSTGMKLGRIIKQYFLSESNPKWENLSIINNLPVL